MGLNATDIATSTISNIVKETITPLILSDTSNSVLADLQIPTRDPLASSFTDGPPNADTFITRPLVTQVNSVDLSNRRRISNSRTSRMNCSLLEALLQRTGLAEILNDADLLLAEAIMFEELIVNALRGLISLLTSPCSSTGSISGVPYGTNATYPTYKLGGVGGALGSLVAVAQDINTLIALNPKESLNSFINSIGGMFSNTPNYRELAERIFIGDLKLLTDQMGRTRPGIPTRLGRGSYNDINRAYAGIRKTIPTTVQAPAFEPPEVVEYRTQQNLFNLTFALSVDSGTTVIAEQLKNDPVYFNRTTTRVIKTMLPSVAEKGHVSTIKFLVDTIGGYEVPDTKSLVSTLIASTPVTDPDNNNVPLSVDDITAKITDIEAIMASLGITIEDIYGKGLCNCAYDGTAVWDAPLLSNGLPGLAKYLVPEGIAQTAHVIM